MLFKDIGARITVDILPKIFDNFFTSRQTEGTGIGLPFCRSVMQSINGEITCRSEPGEFTEFKLVFPKIKKKN